MLKTVILLSLAALTAADDSDFYDYLELTIQWVPGACSNDPDCISPVPERWTVRGLKPKRARGGWPMHCCTPNCPPNCHLQDLKVNERLIGDMGTQWPSLSPDSTTNEQLWEDEYCKHGTRCDDIMPNPEDYFKRTLQLYAEIVARLDAAGIRPSRNSRYTFEQVEEALTVDRASYRCTWSRGKQFLSELGVCLDKTFAVIDCPKESSIDCDKTNKFSLMPVKTEELCVIS